MQTLVNVLHTHFQPLPTFHDSFGLWDLFAASMAMIGVIGMFVFLAIVVWAKQRRRERESFYQHELTRRIAERGEISEEKMLELFREQAAEDHRRRRESQRVGGLINLAVGFGFLIAMSLWRASEPALWTRGSSSFLFLGLIPILVGAALLLASFLPRPKG